MKDAFLEAAIREAKSGLANQNGIPIGSVLVIDGQIVGRGHNKRVQSGSPILHAEMDCLDNAGRLGANEYRRAILYTTLSPCIMCTGTILLFKIPQVIVGENQNFLGAETLLTQHRVRLAVLNHPACIELMRSFIANHPDLWKEDIGE